MKHSKLWLVTMIVSSLFLIATFSVQAADVTITDIIEDVSSVDYITQGTTVVTSNPYIDVANIDIVKATYSQQGTQATVTIQVRGSIENRGKIIDDYDQDSFNDLNFVEYDFSLSTSEQDYTISYANQTGQISNGIDTTNLTSSDFTVAGDTLTIVFPLTSATEVYDNMSVTSMFVKMNILGDEPDLTDFVYLSDIAPNPALEIMEAYAPNIGAVGDTIQFNGSIIPLTGQPPYQYHWDFGDQKTSTELNPTHAYTKTGEYTYTFTVTDQAGDTVSQTGSITISSEGGSNGSSNNQMLLFLAILAIVIVVGVVIIIWIIRRR
ncbi:MAG TPA: PKD domain-containing protein [Candidatus Thermoplasmatota archaeon]|nr:PKD domain-containing protein [Candidatus Thermoplasmatota archaeon]